jgi:hypothetical protein
MKTYLRVINPILAAAVLLLCLHAATYDKGSFTLSGLREGGIPIYFVAKGIFCSATLFIVGRILLLLIAKAEGRSDRD